MTLKDFIGSKNCLILKSRTKTEAFHELFDLAEKSPGIKDMENLKKEIFYREQIMSTGIGRGIGIPHVRFEGIREPRIFAGYSPEGLKNYESIDNDDVKLVVMILVGADQHHEYLRILSLVVGRLKEESLLERLGSSPGVEELADLLTGDD